MSLGFIDEISRINGIPRRNLVEKDLLLHRLLRYLSLHPEFNENYLFKGGTCLIKCYLGYYRFSEDLDFTWRHQEQFEGIPLNQLRKTLSTKIDQLGQLLEDFAREEGGISPATSRTKNTSNSGGATGPTRTSSGTPLKPSERRASSKSRSTTSNARAIPHERRSREASQDHPRQRHERSSPGRTNTPSPNALVLQHLRDPV